MTTWIEEAEACTSRNGKHGVNYDGRRDRAGRRYSSYVTMTDYQEGECCYCRETVFSVESEGESWHVWRVKRYIIEEDPI